MMRPFLSAVLIGSALLLAGCVDDRDYYDGRPRHDGDFRWYRDLGDRRADPRWRDGWRDGRRNWDRPDHRRDMSRDVPRDRYGRPIWPAAW